MGDYGARRRAAAVSKTSARVLQTCSKRRARGENRPVRIAAQSATKPTSPMVSGLRKGAGGRLPGHMDFREGDSVRPVKSSGVVGRRSAVLGAVQTFDVRH
jgi:hypothetical protein